MIISVLFVRAILYTAYPLLCILFDYFHCYCPCYNATKAKKKSEKFTQIRIYSILAGFSPNFFFFLSQHFLLSFIKLRVCFYWEDIIFYREAIFRLVKTRFEFFTSHFANMQTFRCCDRLYCILFYLKIDF